MSADLADFYRHALLDDCVPFWFPRSVDAEHGGFLHCVDRDGSLVDTDKSVWAQGRMSWMLLTLYNTVEPNPRVACVGGIRPAISGSALRGSQRPLGRMFFHVTREGQPIRKRRYAYSEAFAAIAYAAHAKATGDAKSAERARRSLRSVREVEFHAGPHAAEVHRDAPDDRHRVADDHARHSAGTGGKSRR